MAKQLTAPGCKYSIVARVDTTIYSPDQKWVLDVPAGQTDFIAETNEIIIPADAMMCRKKGQIDADLARFNVLGRGAGSLATFITRAIEQIVGKGNARVTYAEGKLAVFLVSSVTSAQVAEVENLLERLLPKDVAADIDPFPSDYMRAEFLESTGTQRIRGTTTESFNNHHLQLRAQAALPGNPAVSETAISSTVFSLKDFTLWVPYNYNNNPRNVRWDFPGEGAGQYYTANDGVYEFSTYKKQEGNCYINGELVLSAISNSTENNIFGLFVRVSGHTSFNRGGQVAWAKVGEPGNEKLHIVAALDPAGIPCMFDTVTRQPFYNSGTGQFIVGLTMAQALNLAHLPAPTTINTLTVSLPKEASLVQHNQEVEAALSIAAEKGWNIAVQYRDEFEDSSIENKYAACKTIAEVKAVNPDYLNDLTSDGDWIYPLDSLTASRGFSNAPARWNVNKIKTRFLQLKSLEAWTFSYANATSIEVYCSDTTTYVGQFAGDNNKLRYLKIYAPKTKTIYSIVWGNGLVDLDFEAPNLENCPNFGGHGGYITHTSAIKFMKSLPTWTSGTHNLKAFTVHIDGKTDPEFQEALTSLENRGWDVDVQWNGTPTNTASTFNMGTLIYAKAGELERPDGTTERILDWGHYVTRWEERGYEQFRSLESAYKYFGLEQEVEA